MRVPACNEIISITADTCRFCKLPIDRVSAQRLLVENQRVTNAVASANTLRFSMGLAVLSSIFGIWGVFTQGRPAGITLLGTVALVYGGLWLYGYGSLNSPDPDYPVAVKRGKPTMAVGGRAAAPP